MRVLYNSDGDLTCILVDEIYYDCSRHEVVISDTVNNFCRRFLVPGLSPVDGRALVHQAFMSGNVDLTKFYSEEVLDA